jgi:hypothetical protein
MLTRPLKESEASEVRLFGDDAASLESMLTWVYNGRITLPDDDEYTLPNVSFCLELYRVADKYDLPELCETLRRRFRSQLLYGLQDVACPVKGQQADPAICEAFCDLIENIYELLHAGSEHPLVATMLLVIDQSPALQILQNDGETPHLVFEASRRHAEFGRDVLLHLLRKSNVTVKEGTGKKTIKELALVFQAMCPECDRIVRMDEDSLPDYDTAWCVACGEHMGYWDDCRVVREQ